MSESTSENATGATSRRDFVKQGAGLLALPLIEAIADGHDVGRELLPVGDEGDVLAVFVR